MAETPPKRLREDSSSEFDESSADSKRPKPYNDILNLLEEEGEPSQELSQDLSAIFTTFQQELSSSTTSCDSSTTAAAEGTELTHHHHGVNSAECDGGDEDDEGVKSVMRHLLEASDDELGIPNTKDQNNNNNNNNVEILNSGVNFGFGGFNDDGLWELEDEAANYYTVLQSELFM